MYQVEFDMKTIPVPARAKILNNLLKKARRRELVLESPEGERFILASLEHWEGFAVGKNGDITENKELMGHLTKRPRGGKRIPLDQVKSELGIP